MIELWYLACMILVTSPFNWHHAVTLTFDLLLLGGGPQFSEFTCTPYKYAHFWRMCISNCFIPYRQYVLTYCLSSKGATKSSKRISTKCKRVNKVYRKETCRSRRWGFLQEASSAAEGSQNSTCSGGSVVWCIAVINLHIDILILSII